MRDLGIPERFDQKSDLIQVSKCHRGCCGEKRLGQGGQGRSGKPAGRGGLSDPGAETEEVAVEVTRGGEI